MIATVNEPINEPIKPIEEWLIELIGEQQGISKEELVKKTGKSRSTITREIKKLSDLGRIKRVGSNKRGYWEVTSS